MAGIYASKSAEVEPRELANKKLSRDIAGECVVLLENDGALPLLNTLKVALYGNGARQTVKGGTGSGDVNSRDVVNIEQGFENAGIKITTKDWIDREQAKTQKAKQDYKDLCEEEGKKLGIPASIVGFNIPYVEPSAIAITEADIKASDCDTAVYVISRNSGEGADRFDKEGDYQLYAGEKENLNTLVKNYKKVIVVLNIGGVMNLTELNAIEGIDAVVLMTQLGNIGGDALLDILTGTVNPSGKTTDTWAKNYMDYPSSAKFSHNESVDDELYEDDIYVGYRYFDSFDVAPVYPFGYGKSYTDFSLTDADVTVEKDTVKVSVKVKNTGSKYAGKEVVQVYYSALVEKTDTPYQELAGYKKTKLLNPGEEETVVVEYKATAMASYSEEESAWILEKGKYIIRVGNSSANTVIAGIVENDTDVVTEKCKKLFKLDVDLNTIKPEKAKVAAKKSAGTDKAKVVKLNASDLTIVKNIYQEVRKELTTDATELITVADVVSGKRSVEEFVAQLTIEEMAELCVGTQRSMEGSIVGNASTLVPGAAGDTSSIVYDNRGLRNLILADGPAGLRLQPHFKTDKSGNKLRGGEILGDFMTPFDDSIDPNNTVDYYQYCTAIPIGWALAQSWNEELLYQIGDMVGSEMDQFHVDLWLAPAQNIHRNPLCGRNFEYFSEDPLIAGKTAAAITKGVQSHPGKGTTIKHFAVNNQEDNRYFVNAHVSERALREIYLKGFEVAVKESQPLSIMTSYNLLNGTHTANHHDLIQAMSRDEWGFKGVIMTDWFTSVDLPMLTGKFKPKYPISASTGCIFAGNDIQMPGAQKNVDDIIDAVKNDKEIDGYKITKADLQYNTANVVRIVIECMKSDK